MTYDSQGRRVLSGHTSVMEAEIEALRREVRRLIEIVDKARQIIERHDNNQLAKETK